MAVMPTLRGQCKSGALGAYAKVAVGVRGGGSLDNLTQVCFSQKLKSKEKTIRSVLFLPPRVVKDDSADAGKEEDSEEIKSSTVGLVSDALRKRGWQVDGSAASRQALTSDSKRSALVDYLRGPPSEPLRPNRQSPAGYRKGALLSGRGGCRPGNGRRH